MNFLHSMYQDACLLLVGTYAKVIELRLTMDYVSSYNKVFMISLK